MARRIVVADAHVITRVGITAVLRSDPQFEVVAEASDGVQTVALCRELRPDLVVLDLRLPRLSAIAVARHLQAAPSPPRTLILSADADASIVRAALEAGAAGFATTIIDDRQLLAGVHRILRGERVLLGLDGVMDEVTAPLLCQEVLILRQVGQGLGTKTIARELGISVRTVTTHLDHIFAKLGVSNRAAAVLRGHQLGFLMLD